MQDEVSAVRILFELLGFLLKGSTQYPVLSTQYLAILPARGAGSAGSVYN